MPDTFTIEAFFFDSAVNRFRGPVHYLIADDEPVMSFVSKFDDFDETIVFTNAERERYFVVDENGIGEWEAARPLIVDGDNDADGLIFWQSDFCEQAAKPH